LVTSVNTRRSRGITQVIPNDRVMDNTASMEQEQVVDTHAVVEHKNQEITEQKDPLEIPPGFHIDRIGEISNNQVLPAISMYLHQGQLIRASINFNSGFGR